MKLTQLVSTPRMPSLCRVRQNFVAPVVEDIEASVVDALEGIELAISAGDSIALAVGSRGIAGLDRIVRAVVERLKRRGAKPFIVPAMGSHGGATEVGQTQLLAQLGITESAMGCPVRATMEVVHVGDALGMPVWVDRHAAEADWIGLINRVKPHPAFDGEIGSGLLKMLAIGLGNHIGAWQSHRAVLRHRYEPYILAAARVVLERSAIAFGLGVVENAHHRVAKMEAFGPTALEAGERALFRDASAWMAKLPFNDIDLLLIDEMGKEIAGTGMDAIVIGRPPLREERRNNPVISFVVVCDLTAESGGNAVGLGGADFTTRRLVDKIDWDSTYVNTITSCAPLCGMLPVVLDTAADAVSVALSCLGRDESDLRMVRIRNTAHLSEIDVSQALLAESLATDGLTVVGAKTPLTFDTSGSLPPF